MQSGFQITCVNKNTHGTIVRMGGPGWSLESHEAIIGIVTKRLRLNIVVGDTHYDVGVRGEGPDSYLALEPGGRPLYEIEDLASC